LINFELKLVVLNKRRCYGKKLPIPSALLVPAFSPLPGDVSSQPDQHVPIPTLSSQSTNIDYGLHSKSLSISIKTNPIPTWSDKISEKIFKVMLQDPA
jgi:hypothetical protein